VDSVGAIAAMAFPCAAMKMWSCKSVVLHDYRHIRGNVHHVAFGYLTVTCTSRPSVDGV
jgi:hypothetical protein